ncbi:NAD(P)/FAD-dependent oxidoreductase [Marinomonas epiphytica]
MEAKQKLVIVGAGMAGSKFADELLKQSADRYEVTLIGKEPQVGYNRIMLSSLLAGEISEQQMALVEVASMQAVGAHIIANDPVERIDRVTKSLYLKSGSRVEYDTLILATGSDASIIPLPGSQAPNVMGFRNWHDVERMQNFSMEHAVAVIGGGLLGLEAAVGLAKQGQKVTVFHRSEWLLNRQLDQASARLLQKKLESMGVQFQLSASPEQLKQDESGLVTHCVLPNGQQIPCDHVIMAAGIRPQISLAKQAGLKVNQAICIDHTMLTSDPHIYALGECSEFAGQTFGLVAPIWTQIKVLLNILQGQTDRFAIEAVATKLKVSGVDLYSVGRVHPSTGDQCIDLQDTCANHYRKLVVNDGVLVGAILYGNVADGSWFSQLIHNQTRVSHMLDVLIFGEAYCQAKVA